MELLTQNGLELVSAEVFLGGALPNPEAAGAATFGQECWPKVENQSPSVATPDQ
jgi:hypothetical protein